MVSDASQQIEEQASGIWALIKGKKVLTVLAIVFVAFVLFGLISGLFFGGEPEVLEEAVSGTM